jgi:cation-transporting ATPase I
VRVGTPPQVISGCAGRVRIHLSDWAGLSPAALEASLQGIDGVRRARANPTTGNVLIEYDEGRVERASLLARAARVSSRSVTVTNPPRGPRPIEPARGERPATPGLGQAERLVSAREVADLLGSDRVVQERAGLLSRARVAVRGLDRDGDLARRLVHSLRTRPGVSRVSVSRLTGRVLIEFDEHQIDVEDLIAHVAGMELPDLPGDDSPSHPLDPAPLIQSAARTTGATLGLGLLAVRRLSGAQGPPSSSSGPVAVAAAIGVLDGLPPLRRALRQALGADRSLLALGAVHVVSLTFAGSPLGLAVSGAGALRLLTEVRARRAAWRSYEERLSGASEAIAGETVRISAGERCPLAGDVIEGTGTMIGRDGLPHPLGPGDLVTGGARVAGGPFIIELRADPSFNLEERPVAEPKTSLDRYLALLSPASLGYAALVGVLTRSPTRVFSALLLVNARPALIGADAAVSAPSARVLRSGVTVVGARYGRSVRLPGVLLIDGTRVLTDRRLQVGKVLSLRADLDETEILSIASGIAAASGSPWGPAFPPSGRADAKHARFKADAATALVGRARLRLGGAPSVGDIPGAVELQDRGQHVLVLSREGEASPLGLVTLRPRLAEGALRLLDTCQQRGVAVELLAASEPAVADLVGDRPLLTVESSAVERVRERQRAGKLVAVLSDSPHAAPAFAAADVAIALTSGLSGRFAARADLLAPDLEAVSALVQAAARRRAAVADAVTLSALSNAAGAVFGLRSAVGLERGSRPTYIAALAAIGLASVRLAGGGASGVATRRLVDPEPEQWGHPSLTDVFRQLDSSAQGLTAAEAQRRVLSRPAPPRQNAVLAAVSDQLRSPLNAALAAGAGISLLFGAVADVALIAAVVVANTGIGVWQERQANQAAELLAREASGTVSVRRSADLVEVQATELVVGDVIALGSGDRVPADARLIESESLEVDEASLTGESLPVSKDTADPNDSGRVILEGSDVTVGTATAVVFAVGDQTRLGATTAALANIEPARGVLDRRLNRLVRQSVPVIFGGAGVIGLSGLAWRRPLASQLALAASIATAVVPEGLPLLAGVAEAAVARRLAGRNALVRRLSAVEALGRVDIACTDKTGTLTAGRLELTAVETFLAQGSRPPTPAELQEVLLTAALASPHPEAPDAGSHPTDLAVIAGAEKAGLGHEIRVPRTAEVPFEPARSFHATAAGGRLMVKGAAEALVERCSRMRRDGHEVVLRKRDRQASLNQAEGLARRGLRVLMVAEGSGEVSAEDPRDLVALGLVGISDPLREGVPAAVARCHQAGVRVIVLTGDHPATAQAVAEQAGLDTSTGNVLTGTEISTLDDVELDRRLSEASVVARITPLDKLRIVERLQGLGHTVAMTGDGVNDAPALRLADVGVAMGLHGTEVARQASDVVLADDDFATLVETLVEGRSFWRNLRRSLGLLMGGNLGELGMMVGASVLGLSAPLSTRQILAVNLVTDILPALAVAAQQPEHRDLATLRREGGQDQDRLLRDDVLRRGWATAAPALAAYALATRLGTPAQARSVAFGGIVTTQLAQTISLGRSEGSLTRPVLGAIAGSGGFALAAMVFPPLSGFLGLGLPTLSGFGLIGVATLISLRLASPHETPTRLSLTPGPNLVPALR